MWFTRELTHCRTRSRYNWDAVEAALAKHAGFLVDRPHRTMIVLSQQVAAQKLGLPSAALRRLADAGNVPHYRFGDGPAPKLFFNLDDAGAALVKLQKELKFQDWLRVFRERPPRKKKGGKS